jgi:hypothetical protein
MLFVCFWKEMKADIHSDALSFKKKKEHQITNDKIV